jgi:uncharacterized protein (DUF2252 family)
MLPWHFQRKTVVLRELLPQDLKLEMDQLTREEAVVAARYLASVVGKPHSSQMTAQTRRHWKAQLGRDRTKKIDAPSWLWRSVVALVGLHESEFLEHCRLNALQHAR